MMQSSFNEDQMRFLQVNDKFEDFLFVWVVCMHVQMCTLCMPGACGGQKRLLDPLQLELRGL